MFATLVLCNSIRAESLYC